MKVCTQCGKEKAVADFSRNRTRKDGLQDHCKECMKVTKWRYERTPAGKVVRAKAERRYKQTPKGKEARRRQRALHPERYHARYALRNAIRHGQIQRQPCEVGGSEPTHGHHDDYSKPLEVRWLCHKHHVEHHQEQEAS